MNWENLLTVDRSQGADMRQLHSARLELSRLELQQAAHTSRGGSGCSWRRRRCGVSGRRPPPPAASPPLAADTAHT